jgi:hypothetical protein
MKVHRANAFSELSKVASCAVLMVVFTGTALAHRGIAYAWIYDGNNALVSPNYSLNPSGQTVTASLQSTGVYLVTFPGSGIGVGWDVQTTAYGADSHYCKTGSWGGEAVAVLCFDVAGNAVNTRFTVLAISNSNDKQISFAWANQPTAASYSPDPNYAYNTSGGAITISRSSAGNYGVVFAGLSGVGGTVQITSYGPGNSSCYSNGWGGSSNFDAFVVCEDTGGNPIDEFFVVAIIPHGVAPPTVAFTWANNSSSLSYTPDATYTYNPGGPVTVVRNSPGNYSVTFTGVNATQIAGGDVRATAYATTIRCKVASWGSGGNTDMIANVVCFDLTGTPADAIYQVLVIPPPGFDFFTVTPCRVIDTRNPPGPLGGPALVAHADRSFTIAGNCGIPATALAVAFNFTVTQPTAAGDLRIIPGGSALPLVSTINWSAGQTRANNGIGALGPSGDISVHLDQASGTVQFIADVTGYFQ